MIDSGIEEGWFQTEVVMCCGGCMLEKIAYPYRGYVSRDLVIVVFWWVVGTE
jgi:hypothetical protein